MKYLVMCEGTNELEIINILLENDLLVFGEDDLLGLQAYHARQISASGIIKTALNIYPGNDIEILRIGDSQNEKLKIPSEYKEKLADAIIKKFCTKPELEILLIISEDMQNEYEKVKSNIKPKIFAKQNILLNKKRYDNSSKFYRDYYGSKPDLLVQTLKNYKKTRGSHKKDELYLADLLK
ncbi:MAG: GNAT family acetyltransferase [Oscillospiraceae bacterium]